MESLQHSVIIYKTVDGKTTVNLFAKEGSVWMNQSQLAELFDTSVANISTHISNILKEKELQDISVIKDYLTTASDGKEYMVSFWKESVNRILNSLDKNILISSGTITNQQMEEHVSQVYTNFDNNRKSIDATLADAQDLAELESSVKKRKDK